MKNIIEELTSYRVKVEKDGKEIINIPSIIALPGALIVPKVSIVGTIAASLLGCSIHVENDKGTTVDVSKKVQEVAETVVDTAKTAAKTVKEEIDKAWDAVSADDPEGCPVGEENAEEEKTSAEDVSNESIVEDLKKQEKPDVPTIQVNPKDEA